MQQPKVDFFVGKKNHVSMSNIGENTFNKFEKSRLDLNSKPAGTSFTEMNAKKSIKLLGEVAIACSRNTYSWMLLKFYPDSLT